MEVHINFTFFMLFKKHPGLSKKTKKTNGTEGQICTVPVPPYLFGVVIMVMTSEDEVNLSDLLGKTTVIRPPHVG